MSEPRPDPAATSTSTPPALDPPPPPAPDPLHHHPRMIEARRRYWRTNLTAVGVLLSIWAAVSLGAGVLFADTLSAYSVGGAPLGFWMAQQGSIATFVVLVLVYALVMNSADRRLQRAVQDAHAELDPKSEPGAPASAATPASEAR
ncbi:MAG: DUF4212 domain-containing protein [Planctomycetota bacterium]